MQALGASPWTAQPILKARFIAICTHVHRPQKPVVKATATAGQKEAKKKAMHDKIWMCGCRQTHKPAHCN